jgi:Holliday junction resolvasome RuvABC endonuclease subunit
MGLSPALRRVGIGLIRRRGGRMARRAVGRLVGGGRNDRLV